MFTRPCERDQRRSGRPAGRDGGVGGCKDGCQQLAPAVCDHGTCIGLGWMLDGGREVNPDCTHIECPPPYEQMDHCARELQ